MTEPAPPAATQAGDPPLPLSRLAVIGLLSDHGFRQAHTPGRGFRVDPLDGGGFRVRHDPEAGNRADAAIAAMAEPLREAGWQVDFPDGPCPHLIVSQAEPAMTPGQRSLIIMTTPAYLAGRMVGLGLHLADWYAARGTEAGHERLADKLARGGLPPTAHAIGQLSSTTWAALRRPEVPAAYHAAYRDITSRMLDVTDWPAPPWPVPGQGEFVLGHHHQSAALTAAVPSGPPFGKLDSTGRLADYDGYDLWTIAAYLPAGREPEVAAWLAANGIEVYRMYGPQNRY